jgi:hypothetical protein
VAQSEVNIETSTERLIKGRYEVLGTLGAGGEGRFVKALDRQHDRFVAGPPPLSPRPDLEVRAVAAAPQRTPVVAARAPVVARVHPGDVDAEHRWRPCDRPRA